MILALTSLGYDVTDIAGYNLLEPLGDFDYVVKQGVNGAIWALIALDSNDYIVPSLSDEEMAALKDKLINFILDNQMSMVALHLMVLKMMWILQQWQSRL